MPPTSAQRFAGVSAPSLGDDVLILLRASGSERMGRPFQYDIDVTSDDPEIGFAKIVGEPMTLWFETKDRKKRFINGIVTRFEFTGHTTERRAVYRATIRPWLWLLSRRADCRIFQFMSAIDIVEQLFRDGGFTDFENRLNRTPNPRDYCVQYRETDFNFVTRLLEEEGIYYYFTHEDGVHKLVLTDGPSGHDAATDYDTVPYRLDSAAAVGEQFISRWGVRQRIQPGAYATTSYDFEAPAKDLAAALRVAADHPHAEYEVYDYPEPYTESADGDTFAKLRAEEQKAEQEVCNGDTNARGLSVGSTFTLEDAPRPDQNREYVVLASSITIEGDALTSSGGNRGSAIPFQCSFEVLPTTVTWRAARLAPKPSVRGIQTATVVGPSGEEIYTDKYGRIKIQFHWDREGKKDENSSCWVRVAQTWSGPAFGTFVLPRLGQEVVVSFLEGDPDKPLVTGTVYNGSNMPPYELPADMTKTVFRSNSTKGGGGFNEFTFEDKKGDELIFIHGQKDKEMKILNDRRCNIGNDQQTDIGNDQTIQVKRNRTKNVGKDESLTIGANRTISVGSQHDETVKDNMTVSVSKDRSLNVSKNLAESIGESMTLSVGKDRSTTIGGKLTVEVAKDSNLTIGAKQTVSVSKESSLQAKKIQLVADDEISLKTGSASIIMKKNGDITIKGKKITVKGSGDVVLKGSKIAQN